MRKPEQGNYSAYEQLAKAEGPTFLRDLLEMLPEQPISRDQLYIADEVLVCGTAAEVIGLREIDFRKIGMGTSGPVTRRLQQAFSEVVRGRHARSKEWLAHIAAPEWEPDPSC